MLRKKPFGKKDRRTEFHVLAWRRHARAASAITHKREGCVSPRLPGQAPLSMY